MTYTLKFVKHEGCTVENVSFFISAIFFVFYRCREVVMEREKIGLLVVQTELEATKRYKDLIKRHITAIRAEKRAKVQELINLYSGRKLRLYANVTF